MPHTLDDEVQATRIPGPNRYDRSVRKFDGCAEASRKGSRVGSRLRLLVSIRIPNGTLIRLRRFRIPVSPGFLSSSRVQLAGDVERLFQAFLKLSRTSADLAQAACRNNVFSIGRSVRSFVFAAGSASFVRVRGLLPRGEVGESERIKSNLLCYRSGRFSRSEEAAAPEMLDSPR